VSRNLPVPRGPVEIARRHVDVEPRDAADLATVCPTCGRVTRTLAHGACAECWQPKTPDARPVLRPRRPATMRLFDLDDIPDWLWVSGAVALAVALVRVVIAFI
jgi:hypothetical protein